MKEYDIIIVGFGAAGMSVANELSKAGSKLKGLVIDRNDRHHDLCTQNSLIKELGAEKAIINEKPVVALYSRNARLIKKTGEKYMFDFINQEKVRDIIKKRVNLIF